MGGGAWFGAVVAAGAVVACGRLGFDGGAPGGVDATGDGGAARIDARSLDGDAAPAFASPYLRCGDVDDALVLALSEPRTIRTLELRMIATAPGDGFASGLVRTTLPATPGAENFLSVLLSPASLQAPGVPRLVHSGSNVISLWSDTGVIDVAPRSIHVAMVVEATGVVVYQDGVVDVPDGASPTPTFDKAIICGGQDTSSERLLDWVRLSATERYAGPFTPPVVAPAVDADTVVQLDFDAGDLTASTAAGLSVTVSPMGAVQVVSP
ncbi:MAG: hypothetical protein R2939_15795 [Kofleriaceae bacterium]